MKNDLQYIYDQLKDKHNITLTRTTAFGSLFSNDVPVLYGERESDRFWVYQEDLLDEDFILMVEFQKPLPSGETEVCHTHGHYDHTSQVMWAVDRFMQMPYWLQDAHERCMNNLLFFKKANFAAASIAFRSFPPMRLPIGSPILLVQHDALVAVSIRCCPITQDMP